MYKYRALVDRVIDGDTIVCDVDLGFYIVLKDLHFRLTGIDAPDDKEGREDSRLFLETVLKDHPQVVIESEKEDKYGRWLATVYLDGLNINDYMLKSGHAKPYGGGKKED